MPEDVSRFLRGRAGWRQGVVLVLLGVLIGLSIGYAIDWAFT